MSVAGSPNSLLAMGSSFPYGTTWISTAPAGRNTAFVSPAPWMPSSTSNVFTTRACSSTRASPGGSTTTTLNPTASAARTSSCSFTNRR
uniref:Uncharacterized protein n=1 Tax=Arundo donax TaxID=35708 RepID=A0A0A9FI20_ARUDO